MKKNIKNVTLQLSQKKISFLQNSENAKFFLDIMSCLTASCTQGVGENEPCLVYGPTAFFHLYELAGRWKVSLEDVLCIILDLELNGLLRYTLSENEYAIEPCISSFTTVDGLVFKGEACDTPIDEWIDDLMLMPAEQREEIMDYYESLVYIPVSMASLEKYSLAA